MEDEYRHSPKTFLLPKKSSLSSQKQYNRPSGSTTQSTGQDIPPVLPPRKPLDKKNSVQMQSAILNPSVFNNSSSQISSNAVDDTSSSSLVPARILPSKEVRRRVYIAHKRYVLFTMNMLLSFSFSFSRVRSFIYSSFFLYF